MTTSHRWRFTVSCSFAGFLLSAACADLRAEEAKAGKQQSAQAEVYAAIDDAIRTFEKRDIRALIENYLPVEILRYIRRQKGGVQLVAKRIQDGLIRKRQNYYMKRQVERQIRTLRLARKMEPVFNDEKTIATFTIIISRAETITAKRIPLLADAKKPLPVSGYGPDLKKALAAARSDLEAGKVARYLSRMLPEVELRLNSADKLAQRLKSQPDVVKRMIADLKVIANQQPATNGFVAAFSIPQPPIKRREGGRVITIRVPDRFLKFQKQNGHWRLFDNTTPLQKSLRGIRRMIPAVTLTFVMEKFRDHWRVSSSKMFFPIDSFSH